MKRKEKRQEQRLGEGNGLGVWEQEGREGIKEFLSRYRTCTGHFTSYLFFYKKWGIEPYRS